MKQPRFSSLLRKNRCYGDKLVPVTCSVKFSWFVVLERHETGTDWHMTSIFNVALMVLYVLLLQTVPITIYFYASMCFLCTSLLPMLTQTRSGLSPPYVLATCLLVCADLVSIWSLYGRLPNWKKYPEGPGTNNAKIATVTTAERFLQGCRLYLWFSQFFRSTGGLKTCSN